MRGVGGLDELMRRSEIVANDDVDVLLVRVLCFLRVSHAFLLSLHNTTLRFRSCQEDWRSRRGSNPRPKGFRGPSSSAELRERNSPKRS
jgi:hypothetical protein